MGNIMIPQELFQQLIRYHLLEDNSCMEEIQRGLERKLDSLVLRELYQAASAAASPRYVFHHFFKKSSSF